MPKLARDTGQKYVGKERLSFQDGCHRALPLCRTTVLTLFGLSS